MSEDSANTGDDPEKEFSESIAKLVELIEPNCRIVVMTGAGVSADSGIATFRDSDDSMWSKFNPHELATESAFIAHPERVWSWYQWRREQIHAASPNPAHHALVDLASLVQDFIIITQNVDGFHHLAGSDQIIELHGNIMRSKCHKTHELIDEKHWHAGDQFQAGPPPASPHHKEGMARPDVVWFGEALNAGHLNEAAAASLNCDLFFSVGTSSMVEPAASLGILAARTGAVVIEINPQKTPLTEIATISIQSTAAIALTSLIHQIGYKQQSSQS